jgi:hypothetical protein
MRASRLLIGAVAVLLLAGAGALDPGSAAAKHSKRPAHLVASDTAATPDPVPFWGEIECASPGRYRFVGLDGDPHPTLTGAPQGNTSFRRLSVLDGDDVFGERCELGDNNNRGPTVFYREGRRLITAISIRLQPSVSLMLPGFQTVMQMKQTGPSANANGSPAIALLAYLGEWRLRLSGSPGVSDDSRELFAAPARIGIWTRFWFDVRYSRSAKKGAIRVAVDLDGDNDVLDPGETSPRIPTFTLKREIPGGGVDGVPPGLSIPSHLRAGIYHDSVYACPSPAGCQIDIDNAQVLAPAGRR